MIPLVKRFTVNSFLVRTPKIILKLLLKTISFSSNSDFFHAFEFLILRTLKNARNNAWTSQNHAKSLDVLFSPDATSKGRQLYRLNVWCTVRVESDLRTSTKCFIDVLMFILFGKISWRKKWLSSMKLKTKSEKLECVIFYPFNLQHHSFYTGYTTICEDFYPLNGRKKKNPTLPVHHIYVLLDLW